MGKRSALSSSQFNTLLLYHIQNSQFNAGMRYAVLLVTRLRPRTEGLRPKRVVSPLKESPHTALFLGLLEVSFEVLTL